LAGDNDGHLTAVGGGTSPPQQPCPFAAVDQLDHGVMVELHSFRQPAYGGYLSRRKAAYSQNHLILLGVRAQPSDLLLHASRETPQLVAKLRQRDVLSLKEAPILAWSHYIASRYIPQLC